MEIYMKIKSGFVVQKVGGSYLAVAVGERADEFNALIRMNETGAFLWEKLAESELTEDALVGVLRAEYEVGGDIARNDVKRFVEQLERGGLLEA